MIHRHLWTAAKFVNKGTWISFQDSATSLIDLSRMLSRVVARLALAFWAAGCAESKTLAVEFQAPAKSIEGRMEGQDSASARELDNDATKGWTQRTDSFCRCSHRCESCQPGVKTLQLCTDRAMRMMESFGALVTRPLQSAELHSSIADCNEVDSHSNDHRPLQWAKVQGFADCGNVHDNEKEGWNEGGAIGRRGWAEEKESESCAWQHKAVNLTRQAAPWDEEALAGSWCFRCRLCGTSNFESVVV